MQESMGNLNQNNLNPVEENNVTGIFRVIFDLIILDSHINAEWQRDTDEHKQQLKYFLVYFYHSSIDYSKIRIITEDRIILHTKTKKQQDQTLKMQFKGNHIN